MDSQPRVMLDHLVEAAAHAAWQSHSGRVVEFVGPKTPLWVQADPGLVGQIVGELVRNAVDAVGEKGRVRVSVELKRVADNHRLVHHDFDTTIPPGAFALLSVWDDGPGVPTEVKARLFQPFASTKEWGRGLGLATVYGIAKALGWYVDAESKPGSTLVSVFLPLADPTDAEPKHSS